MLRKKTPEPTPSARMVALPLEEFYTASGFPPPQLTRIEGGQIPEPYRSLLVQQQDMTPMLEKHYQQPVHLHILGERQTGDSYSREYVLLLDENQRLIEFGGIKINLAFLGDAVRRRIMRGRRPLGHILKENKIKHSSRPWMFFHLTSGAVINKALNLSGPHVLHGRCSTLLDAKDRTLAELVEVLPPAIS